MNFYFRAGLDQSATEAQWSKHNSDLRYQWQAYHHVDNQQEISFKRQYFFLKAESSQF